MRADELLRKTILIPKIVLNRKLDRIDMLCIQGLSYPSETNERVCPSPSPAALMEKVNGENNDFVQKIWCDEKQVDSM